MAPLLREHAAPLAALIESGALYPHPHTSIPAPADVPAYIEEALEEQRQGRALPFVTCVGSEVVGTTRFCRVAWPHRRVEIGYTWLAPKYQGRGINRAAKHLMLDYAFETLGMQRVEFITDLLNLQSQRALERIGARREGLLRRHMRMADGRVRDSVVYSIVDTDRRSKAPQRSAGE
ncbi:MAG: GNAT family protein [Pseudomonadota bacterium]|nr:GNAT family protein [Pseudomonadota bacterium]